jgi:hypothetical protein
MAIRKVMLTESQLARLVKRIVREAEDEMEYDTMSDEGMEDYESDYEGMEDYEEEGEEMSPEEIIANWFEGEGLLDLPERKLDRIEDKIDQIESKSMMERYIREDEEMGRKRSSFSSRMMKAGGGVMSVAGLMGFIGNSMGWSEFQTTQKLHELTELLNTSNYVGPISVAMIAAGIGLVLAGNAKSYNEKRR